MILLFTGIAIDSIQWKSQWKVVEEDVVLKRMRFVNENKRRMTRSKISQEVCRAKKIFFALLWGHAALRRPFYSFSPTAAPVLAHCIYKVHDEYRHTRRSRV
jgi:hypothetical protein